MLGSVYNESIDKHYGASEMTKTTAKSTTAKVAISHDRVALTVKFADGFVLKTAVNRYSDTFKVVGPVGAKSMPDVKALWKFIDKKVGGENHGQRFERLAKFFEGHATIDGAVGAAK